MSDDLLARLSAALAEEKQGETAVPAATRGRVLASLRARQGKRRLRMVWGMPLLAVFVGSTAWAGYSGQLPTLLEQFSSVWTDEPPQVASSRPLGTKALAAQAEPALGAATSAEPTSAAPAVAEPSVAAPTLTEPSVVPLAGADAPVSSTRSGAAQPAAARSAASTSTSTSARGTAAPLLAIASSSPKSPLEAKSPASTSADNLALYRSAHRAQFVAADYREALQGYGRYLEAEPQGGLATEARYNSALCLLRLGRDDDAMQALRPFAAAAVGSYRQAEAQALLEALAR